MAASRVPYGYSVHARAGSDPISPLESDVDSDAPVNEPKQHAREPIINPLPSKSSSNGDREPQSRSHPAQHHHLHSPFRLKGWPDKPQKLTPSRIGLLAWDAHDLLLCLLPVCLAIKAGLCIYASRVDRDHHGVNFDRTSQLTINLVRFNMQLTTLFTVIFILIIATTVKRYALWKAQQGASIADLEQFNSSVSMTATLNAIWSLRAFSWVSLFLLFIWSWYYVGSQASEREYTFQESGPMANINLAHVSNTARSPFLDGNMSSFPTVKRTDLTSRYHIYMGTVDDGVPRAPFDINGYPLTPYYDNTPANSLDSKRKRKIDVNGWLDVTEFSHQRVVNAIGTVLYTNLYDSKSTNFSTNWYDGKVIGTFTYETTNFYANCSRTSLLNQSTYPGLLPVMTISMNMTNQTGPITPETIRSFNVWEQYNQSHSLQATCSITEIHTDVKVKCSAAGCKPVAVRPTQNIAYPSLRTPFDDDRFAAEFFNSLLLACGTPDTLTDLTLLEASNGWESLRNQLRHDFATGINPSVDLADNAYAQELSIGLTNHINTFYSASLYMKFEHVNELQLLQSAHFTIDPQDTNYTIIPIYGAEVSLRYTLSAGWITVDIISNLILLLAAILSFYLRRNTLAPDVFGYVSSLTRDNPHIQLPAGGSALSGMERARRMKHVKVRLGEMDMRDGIGRIVMTHDQDEMVSIKKLARTKTYA